MYRSAPRQPYFSEVMSTNIVYSSSPCSWVFPPSVFRVQKENSVSYCIVKFSLNYIHASAVASCMDGVFCSGCIWDAWNIENFHGHCAVKTKLSKPRFQTFCKVFGLTVIVLLVYFWRTKIHVYSNFLWWTFPLMKFRQRNCFWLQHLLTTIKFLAQIQSRAWSVHFVTLLA